MAKGVRTAVKAPSGNVSGAMHVAMKVLAACLLLVFPLPLLLSFPVCAPPPHSACVAHHVRARCVRPQLQKVQGGGQEMMSRYGGPRAGLLGSLALAVCLVSCRLGWNLASWRSTR